jgi:hypothetical protein
MIQKLSSDIDYYKKSCGRVRTLAWMISFFSHQLPNPPKGGPVGEIGIFKVIFSRSVVRMIYFAEQYVRYIENEFRITDEMAAQPSQPQQFGRPISDGLFFNFDAFVFSSKVITEKNLLDTGKKYFHTSIRDSYSNYLNGFLSGFNVRLRDIRNEISHMNKVGTSIGSLLYFDNGNVTVRSEHNNGEDLIPLFDELFTNTITFIENMARFIFQNDCAEYGNPNKDQGWDGQVKTSEFVKIVP